MSAQDIVKASAYVRSIRNERKRLYAAAYLAYRMGTMPKPNSGELAYMAAQGVRLGIDSILAR